MNENPSATRVETVQSDAVEGASESALAFVRGMLLLLIACAALVLMFLQGCATPEAESDASGEPVIASQSATATDDGTADSFEAVAASFDASALDLEYSNRDRDASYDDASATHIVLAGGSATVDGAGATVDGSTVTVSVEGTYVVSGSLDDGQLVVETADTEKVQVVLVGASIHNEDGPAIYVKQAGKCFVTLADGTRNALSDGANYALETDSDEPYATLFSRDDLTLNGSGTLTVTAAYRHAICSKDDLVITGGTYAVTAVEDALRGRDCVKIADGDFMLAAGGDGIKSNNDTDATRGFVSIDGGTFAIEAGDDGIQAQTYLRIAGGSLDVFAVDDALHSNLEGVLSGGELTVEAGDDAFHAETKLVIDDGTVDIVACYEGYEAEKIYVNGGTTHIVASDDAINASAADLTDGDAAADDAAAANAGAGSNSAASTGFEPSALLDGAGASGDAPTLSDGEAPAGGAIPELPDGATDPEDAPSGDGSFGPVAGGKGGKGGDEGVNESRRNGGAPDNAFAEGGAGLTMGDENCLIQINGGYTVLDSGGDSVDSNGSVEITGGVLLVNGPASGGDGAFDYDLTASVTGGTVLMVGSAGMAQNFTSGTQPFAFAAISGVAGQSVAVVDADGAVAASLTAAKQFGTVLVSSPAFDEGAAYSLVVGGAVDDANDDGYADSGTVTGGVATEITASITASGGMGGLGSGGGAMPAGKGGDVQRGMRGAGGATAA